MVAPYIFLAYYLEDKTVTQILDYLKRVRHNAHFIIMSCVGGAAIINNLLRYKPAGIISKKDGVNEILDCIYAIGKGQDYQSPLIAATLANGTAVQSLPFTSREIEILRLFLHKGSLWMQSLPNLA